MRELAVGMQAAVAAQTGTLAYLFRIETSGGSLDVATTPTDLEVEVDPADGAEPWIGIGGTLVFSGVEETSDLSGQGVELTMSGVDQSVIALLLNNQTRGRSATIWLVMLGDNGTIVDAPVKLGRYLQLSDYVITEVRSREEGTCTIKTRVESSLAVFSTLATVRTNTISHNDALKRAALTTGDTFFQNSLKIAGTHIMWGPFQIGEKARATRKG